MKIKTINALFRYFEMLYTLNQNLIILCGADVSSHMNEHNRRIDEILLAIPRLIPYCSHRGTEGYKIAPSDGLMEFSNDISFLQEDYESILLKHQELLTKVKKIRNKLEHKMHSAIIMEASSGNFDLFSFTYKADTGSFELQAKELITFVKELNILFTKIQHLVSSFAYDRAEESYSYCYHLTGFEFSEFNKVFNSDLLWTIGRTMQPF